MATDNEGLRLRATVVEATTALIEVCRAHCDEPVIREARRNLTVARAALDAHVPPVDNSLPAFVKRFEAGVERMTPKPPKAPDTVAPRKGRHGSRPAPAAPVRLSADMVTAARKVDAALCAATAAPAQAWRAKGCRRPSAVKVEVAQRRGGFKK